MKQFSTTAILAICLASLLISCTTSTKLTAHWYNKEYEKGKVKKVLILGIAKRDGVRRLFEDDMVEKLAYYGVTGIQSYLVFPMDQKLDSTTFRLHFKNEEFDVVLTSQLVSADKEEHYEAGYNSGPYRGYGGYGGGFYGYYGSSWNNMYSPGYTYTTTTIKIETNLYDTSTEKLVWSGMSETFNPNDEMDAIRSLNRTISHVLNEQGFFYKAATN